MYPIVSAIISYDSTRAITVTKRNMQEYYVKMYDLETYELTFEEKVGGEESDYIKLKEVEQNSSGTHYAIAYSNDGRFFLRTFGKTSRSPEEIAQSELNINKLLGIDNWTMAIEGFPDPFVTCCFVSDELVFVNLFHNYSLTHYHFLYNIKANKLQGSVVSREIDCSKKNFPYKCFYNEEKNEIYAFYRQGHSFIIEADDVEKYLFHRMTEKDLG